MMWYDQKTTLLQSQKDVSVIQIIKSFIISSCMIIITFPVNGSIKTNSQEDNPNGGVNKTQTTKYEMKWGGEW